MAKEFLIDRAQADVIGPHRADEQEWAMSVKVGVSLLRAAELKEIRNLPVRPEETAGPISTQITAEGVSVQLETFIDEERMRGIYMLGKAIKIFRNPEKDEKRIYGR